MTRSVRSLAASRCEAVKCGEVNPKEAASLASDSSFTIGCSHVDLLGGLQPGLSTSEMPGGLNS